jgi:hypothetical protein
VRTYNGTSCYSSSLPVTVRILPARLVAAAIDQTPLTFNLFPSPAKDVLNTTFSSQTNDRGMFILIDAMGKIVKQQSFDIVEGENNFAFDIADLPSGIYHSWVKIQDMMKSKDVVVLR